MAARISTKSECQHWCAWIPYLGTRKCDGEEDRKRCTLDRTTMKTSGKKMTMWTCSKCEDVVMCERHKRRIMDHSRVHASRGKKTGF